MLNRTDARAIGVGSAVAAVVAVVSVVVYKGHVKATHDGHGITIVPGATAQIPANVEPPDCDAGELDAAGVAAFDRNDFAGARAKLGDAYLCDKDPNILRKLVVVACAAGDKNDAAGWAMLLAPPGHTVSGTELGEVSTTRGVDLGAFIPAKPEASAKPCDAATPKQNGEGFMSRGMDMAALVQFQGSLRCKQDPDVVKLAYIAACRAKAASKAKQYFKLLSDAQKGALRQICIRAGVDPQ
jgi:hypothetical protein